MGEGGWENSANVYMYMYPCTHRTDTVSFVQVVVQADPDLVALHCQEVGGKDFEICMPKVKDFIRWAAVQCTSRAIVGQAGWAWCGRSLHPHQRLKLRDQREASVEALKLSLHTHTLYVHTHAHKLAPLSSSNFQRNEGNTYVALNLLQMAH